MSRETLLALCGLAALTSRAESQRRGSVFETGLHATTTVVIDGPAGLVAGPRFAIRSPSAMRFALSLGGGVRDGEATGAGTLTVEYLLTPRVIGRLGIYAGGGLAGVVGNGEGGYLLAYIGAERSPGAGSGWALEAGVGGGIRVRLAYHWRRLPAG